VTAAQIALASLDAFVIMASASVTGNLLAGWIARLWSARRGERFMSNLRAAMPAASPGVVREPIPILAGRCDHLRVRELCDDCNETKKGG
jgi:hypothetical protein